LDISDFIGIVFAYISELISIQNIKKNIFIFIDKLQWLKIKLQLLLITVPVNAKLVLPVMMHQDAVSLLL
jgi:hypothetical protein